jgi:paraquat-inducible protein B
VSDERSAVAIRTATTQRKSWWPGWIWAIPIAAIGIVVWLLVRALSSRGVEVTLILEDASGMSDNNTKVLYRGLEVGTVSDLVLAPDGQHVIARLDIDRDMSPYIHSGTRFYVEGTHPSLFDPASLKAIVSGPTIDLVPAPGGGGEPARRFVAIEGKPPERLAVAVPYMVTFSGAVGGIEAGSPVTLGGFRVGEVASTELATDARAGRIDTRALLWLDPTRFHIEGAHVEGGPIAGGPTAGGPTAGGPIAGVAMRGEDWASVMNSTLAQLVAHGLRASVSQTPPLIGDLRITLEMRPDAPRAELGTAAGYRTIPAVEAGGLEAFSRKLSRVPIDQIGDNVREITARLRALSSSPQLDASIRHLDDTLTQLDRTVRSAGPQVAPTLRDVQRTVATLKQTAANIDATAAAARTMMNGSTAAPGGSMQQSLQELTNAARSIRALANYLDQHPEALIRGR